MAYGVLLCSVVVMVMLGACQGQICPPGWTFFDGGGSPNCYRWYNGPQRLDWYSAQAFCLYDASKDCTFGNCQTSLVSIETLQENEFLLDFWKTSREPVEPTLGQHYWIGYREGYGSGFEWIDGSPKYFENWDNGEPNYGNDGPYCAVMWKGVHNEDEGKWDDQPCYLEKPFICKFRV